MTSSSPRTMNVLIIEDVAEMRELLDHVIGSIAGVKICGSCSNTVEARLELTRRRPDLVLLDEILPGESSVELLDDLVAQEIPVWLITGVEDPTHEIPPGALGRLIKPTWETADEDRIRFERAILKKG